MSLKSNTDKTEAEIWDAIRIVFQSKRQGNVPVKEAVKNSLCPLIHLGGNELGKPFFLAPGGLGDIQTALVYAMLAPYISQKQSFYTLKARGHDRGETPHNTVEEMAADYILSIRSIQKEGPYLLGGECTGGVVAFEMAHQLLAQGQKVALFLLDSKVPNYGMHSKNAKFYSSRKSFFIATLDSLKEAPYSKLLFSYIFRKFRTAIKLVANTSFRESRRRTMSFAEAYFSALSRYRLKVYPGKIFFIVDEKWNFDGVALEWSELALGGLDIYIAPGNHRTYIRENAQVTGELLSACLEAALNEFK